MTKVWAIAIVTLREAIRQKLAVNLLIFAIALVIASLVLSQLTFGEQYRVIVNLGLSSMEIFGTLIAVFLGAGLVSRDIERKTVYPIIAKAVSRGQYVAGRYLGLVITTTLNLAVMATVLAGVLAVYLRGLAFLVETPFFVTVLAMAVQFAMIAGLAVLFSCFTTTTLSAIFTLSLVVAGHLATGLVRYWAKMGGELAKAGSRLIYFLIPNLEALNLKETMVYSDPVPTDFAVTGLVYGVAYALAALAIAAAIFTRRDLK
jgi:Cu-processing system permease protein